LINQAIRSPAKAPCFYANPNCESTALSSFAQKVPRVSILTCDRRHFSRKGAKTQRKTLRNAAALCVFAPLREKPSGIEKFLWKAALSEKILNFGGWNGRFFAVRRSH
jgi:hypothetical protein